MTSFAFDAWFDEQQWDGNHLHYFSLPAIRTLARKCGLRVDEVSGVGRAHALKALLPSVLASEITLALVRD